MEEQIVIVGGGQAAAYAIQAIRKINSEYKIVLISEENELPYERPPLSKDYIIRNKNIKNLNFFDDNFYQSNNIRLVLNKSVTYIDFNNRKLSLSDNDKVNYDKLLITTGSKNKKIAIEGISSEEIFQLRNINDSNKIIEKAKTVKNIAIVGGGFIGLEIASSLSQLKKNIFVIEALNQLMGRSIPKEIAELVMNKHIENNVNIILNNKISEVSKENNSYKVKLSNQEIIKVEMIIVGIGVEPQTEFLDEKDIKLDNGIVVDEFCQTSKKEVYAAGDVSNFFHPFYNSHIRLESWRHAQNHGINAGNNITGNDLIYDDIPWMWSDQYNFNLQLTGIHTGYDNCIQRGERVEEGIIYFYLKNNQIIGACGLGEKGKIGRDIRLTEIIIKQKKDIDTHLLKDKNIKLQKLK